MQGTVRDMDNHGLYLPEGFVIDLAMAKTIDAVPDIIAHWFSQIFSADRASITIPVSDDTLKLVSISGNRAIETGTILPIEGTMVGRVFASAMPELNNDLTVSLDTDCVRLAEKGIYSCLDIPLMANGGCLGTINLGRECRDGFTSLDLEKATGLARFIAAMMHIHGQAAKAQELSDYDSLTSILNRRAFIQRFDALSQDRRQSRGIGLAILDVDHFKSINDTHGHQIGDEVLIELSAILQNTFRDCDFISRIGGEEFCIAITDIDCGAFTDLLERLLLTFRTQPIATQAGELFVRMSMGAMHLATGSGQSFDAVYDKVDKALYRAKKAGRDRCEFATLPGFP